MKKNIQLDQQRKTYTLINLCTATQKVDLPMDERLANKASQYN